MDSGLLPVGKLRKPVFSAIPFPSSLVGWEGALVAWSGWGGAGFALQALGQMV